jgi:C_GCAxxG_C_C family probable redox protein
MDRQDRADTLFASGFNCSQSVLSAFIDLLPLDEEAGLKISAGFGGGMRGGEVCGAVTGALMVLGMLYGQTREGDTQTKEAMYAMVREFTRRFSEANGTLLCRELLGLDLSDAVAYASIQEKGLFQSICPQLIESAVDILEEMLCRKNPKSC